MEYKVIDEKSYKIHLINHNRYKYTTIKVVFRNKARKTTSYLYSFLAQILNISCKKYPTYQEIMLAKEELYDLYSSAFNQRFGYVNEVSFNFQMLNYEYALEKDYLENVIKFIFEVILNPNVIAKEFDKTSFDIIKKDILLEIDSVKENPTRLAINNAINVFDKDSIASWDLIKERETIEKLTPAKIYELYKDLINNANVDIFIAGNTNLNEYVPLIKKYYHNHRIRNNEFNYYLEYKPIRKPKYQTDPSNFEQSQLIAIYNVNNLTKIEKEVTFYVLNQILGSGGITNKLYQSVREKHQYCYYISSSFYRFDNIYVVSSALDIKNANNAIKLIDKAIMEMKNGEFTDEEFNNAKNNVLVAYKINQNSRSAILVNYENKVFNDSFSIAEKIDLLDTITKEDIIALAKKIKANIYYVLSEVNDGRN